MRFGSGVINFEVKRCGSDVILKGINLKVKGFVKIYLRGVTVFVVARFGWRQIMEIMEGKYGSDLTMEVIGLEYKGA